MSPDVIDLSGSPDRNESPNLNRPYKRQRLLGGRDDDDDDDVICITDDDEVVIVDSPVRHQRGEDDAQQQEEDLGDNDLLVTGVSGQIANVDFPHSRCDCGVRPFKQSIDVTNKDFCSLCHCFVCDCLASECELWGTGGGVDDHCHAFSTTKWEALRKQWRKKIRDREGTDQATNQTVTGGPGPSSSQPKISLREDREEVLEALAPLPRLPLIELKDPRVTLGYVELGTLRLRVKVTPPADVSSIQARLSRFGYKFSHDLQERLGSKLCIHNLFDRQWKPITSRYEGVHLQVQGLVGASTGGPPEPDPLRMVKVILVDMVPDMHVQTVAVKVHHQCRCSQLLKVLQPFLRTPLGSNHVMKLATIYQGSLPMIKPNAWRLSKGCYSPGECYRGPIYAFRALKVDKGPSTSTPYLLVLNKARTGTGAQGTPLKDVGHPMLILGTKGIQGGPKVAQEVVAAMARALKPFSKSNHHEFVKSPNVKRAPFVLSRCTDSSYDPNQSFEKNSSRHALTPLGEGVWVLTAVWECPAPGRTCPYDLQAWGKTVMHAAVNPNIDEDNARLEEQQDLYEHWTNNTSSILNSALDELKAGSVCLTFGGKSSPLLALDMVLEEVQPGLPDSSQGILSITCFTWKRPSGMNTCVFKSMEEWPTVNHLRTTEPAMKLRNVMLLLAEAREESREMIREFRQMLVRDEMEQRSLITLVRKLEAQERPAALQPAGLSVTLKPYQLQSLQFMIDNETIEGGLGSHLWVPWQGGNGGDRFWYSPVFDRLSWEVPTLPWGGYLAEEMGLGKTVEILALMLANPPPPSLIPGTKDEEGLLVGKGTLVVCAVSLVGQWMAEARSKAGAALSMHMYHGPHRCRKPRTLATEYDLVVTTYATLTTDYNSSLRAGGQHHPLGAIQWHRVVFDESHVLKIASTSQHKACMALKSLRRWSCSGTPINNSIEDLYGQMAALHWNPLNKRGCFHVVAKTPYTPGGAGATGGPLHYILSKLMIRHTKQQVIAGEAVLTLPGRTEYAVAVDFTPQECQLYLKLYREALTGWQRYRSQGAGMVARNLLAIMALLSPLRRMCSGGELSRKDLAVGSEGEGPDASLPLSDLQLGPDVVCSICTEAGPDMEVPVVTPCGHFFCFECVVGWLDSTSHCPNCRAATTRANLKRVKRLGVSAEGSGGAQELTRNGEGSSVLCTSKLQALVRELRGMRESDATAKALVFSQYNNTLTWLQKKLPGEGFQFRTITGSMPLKQRSAAIEAFQQDPPTTVFLLSVRSGAVGINLTAASHVYLLEPCLNPALEEQAIGRCCRMGQQRPVQVKKFYVKGSVEEKIIEVVKRRQEADHGATRPQGDGAGPSTSSRGHVPEAVGFPSRGDESGASYWRGKEVVSLPGSLKGDRQQLKVDELDLLFEKPRLKEK